MVLCSQIQPYWVFYGRTPCDRGIRARVDTRTSRGDKPFNAAHPRGSGRPSPPSPSHLHRPEGDRGAAGSRLRRRPVPRAQGVSRHEIVTRPATDRAHDSAGGLLRSGPFMTSISTVPATRSRWRWLELILVFGVAPLVLALAPRRMVTVGIIGSGLASLAALLLDPTFPRRQLWDAALARQGLRALAIRTICVWAGLFLLCAGARPRAPVRDAAHAPDRLAAGDDPISADLGLFAGDHVPHAVLSPLRGAAAHGRRRACSPAACCSAGRTSWCTTCPRSSLATIGGLLFAATYERRRSTLLVSIEHGLYGDFIFTVGLGGLFYNVHRALAAVSPVRSSGQHVHGVS